jgi:integrase
MARIAPLLPTLVKSRKAQGKAPWCLSVPAALSSTGQRQRLFYPTKSGAALDADRLAIRRDNFGVSLTSMTPARIAEAAEAYNLLDACPGISLLSAVRAHIATFAAQSASVSFLDLFNEYIAAKSDRNAAYVNELRITRDRFPQLHEKLVCDIRPADLEALLSKLSPGARNPILRYWRAILNFGVKREYLTENPVARLDFVTRPRQEVVTIPVAQVSAMLNHALENDLKLLPYLVFGFFCGIRPTDELSEIEWSDVKADQVVIRPEVSKTNRRRFVDISSNAQTWLDEYAARGGVMTGRVVQFTPSELRSHRTANWKAAGVVKWPQTGMRHSYCSNWLASFKDVNKLVLQSGHDNVDTMWRSYHQGIQESEAVKYWGLMPSREASKIISITAAA